MAPAPRWPIILRAFLRVLTGTSLVPAFLVVGLLSVPASCQCGAALPHDHSLFVLASHTHNHVPDGRQHVHGPAPATKPPAQRAATELRVPGPALQLATDVTAGQPRALCLPLVTFLAHDVVAHVPLADSIVVTGMMEPPESPPPQG
jgi:hypothetical protein